MSHAPSSTSVVNVHLDRSVRLARAPWPWGSLRALGLRLRLIWLVGKLHRMQPRIQAALAHELAVRPPLADLAVMQHENEVSMLDGGELVRNDERSSPLHQA